MKMEMVVHSPSSSPSWASAQVSSSSSSSAQGGWGQCCACPRGQGWAHGASQRGSQCGAVVAGCPGGPGQRHLRTAAEHRPQPPIPPAWAPVSAWPVGPAPSPVLCAELGCLRGGCPDPPQDSGSGPGRLSRWGPDPEGGSVSRACGLWALAQGRGSTVLVSVPWALEGGDQPGVYGEGS